MDPNLYNMDPEGDLLLVVKEKGFRMIMSIEIDEYKLDHHQAPHQPLNLHQVSNAAPLPPIPMDEPPSGHPWSTKYYLPVIQHGRVRVSSKRLSLVSPYFWEILKEIPFSPFVRIEVDIPLSADELDAFVILLDIIHRNNQKVPRFLTFDQIFSITTLASLYRCMEVVEEYADGWLENIKGYVPVEYSWDSLRWIWVSFTYRKDLQFKKTTRLALKHENGPIVALGLPIPQNIISLSDTFLRLLTCSLLCILMDLDMIEHFRQKNIGHIIGMIQYQIERMIEGMHCCDKCDAFSLGSLLQFLKAKDLYPLPEAPFKGVSFADLLKSLPCIPSSSCNEFFSSCDWL